MDDHEAGMRRCNFVYGNCKQTDARKMCWGQQTEVPAQAADQLLGTQAGVPWLDCSLQLHIQYKNTNDIVMV